MPYKAVRLTRSAKIHKSRPAAPLKQRRSDFDTEKALEAMVNSSRQDRRGMGAYMKYGFIPVDVEGEATSKTLEYAYDDWCVARMAEDMGRRSGSEYNQGTLTTAAIQGLLQVGLLGLGGQARRGAATLHVNQHEGQLSHYSQSQSLALERQTGAGSSGHCQVSGKRRSDS